MHGLPTADDLSSQNIRIERSRRTVRIALLFMLALAPTQIFCFTFIGDSRVLDQRAAAVSIGLNLAMILIIAAYGWFNFRLAERFGWNRDRCYSASTHAVMSIVSVIVLAHIHIAGSSSSLLPMMLVSIALLVAWLLGQREAWGYFGFGVLGLVGVFALERAGQIPYFPLSAQRHLVPTEVFLEGRYLGAILVLFMANAGAVLSIMFDYQRSLQKRNEQLIRTQEQLRRLATTDALTGLHNRRSAFEKLESELARAARERSPLTVALVDLDDFKEINDTYGHQIGDTVLKKAASVLKCHFRPYDVVARIGGEEFLAVSINTGAADALKELNRVRHAIEQSTVLSIDGEAIDFTASFGFAVFHDAEPVGVGRLLHAADQALYESKANGKNRVTRYQGDMGNPVTGADTEGVLLRFQSAAEIVGNDD
ncbi:MAG: GGDEF domain-containing protein [Deltaproteobacteria bacterium]|nr:GGDEF domain-containing protein [Deltaproteobacteria bacterium]